MTAPAQKLSHASLQQAAHWYVQLQDENAKLKRMYADLALMHHALKDVVERKL